MTCWWPAQRGGAARIGDPRAVPALSGLATYDSAPELRVASVRALADLRAILVIAWQRSADPTPRGASKDSSVHSCPSTLEED